MSNVSLVIAIASIAIAVIQSFLNHSRSSQRRIYWSCTGIAAIAGFFAVYPDWRKGLGLGLFFLVAMTLVAFAYTPYIKIGEKNYALTVQDSRPDETTPPSREATELEYDPTPDAYSGILAPATMWWLIVLLMVISAGTLYAFLADRGDGLGASIGVGFLILLASVSGYGDASWEYPIARGQRKQLAIATVITAGTFAILYLSAYYAGKHRPLRRKQSMEHRAHPRHRRREQ